MIRTRTEPTTAVTAARSAVWAVDPDQPVDDVRTMEQYMYDMRSGDFAMIALFVTFALFALAMAAMGIYGVMSFMVTQRTREIGIRMALGARPNVVLGPVMMRGLFLTGLGLAFGLLAAVGAGRALSSQLFEVSPADPLTLVSVTVLLGAAALFACYWPARRATRVDPMITLRVE